jgi:hypothetical protein
MGVNTQESKAHADIGRVRGNPKTVCGIVREEHIQNRNGKGKDTGLAESV